MSAYALRTNYPMARDSYGHNVEKTYLLEYAAPNGDLNQSVFLRTVGSGYLMSA